MTGQNPTVAIIAPFGTLASLAEKVAAGFPRPLLVLEGDLAKSLKPARAAVRHGVRVFVSRGGTARLLKEELSQPVIEIAVSTYDVLAAMVRGNPEGLPVAVVGFGNVISGIKGLSEILNLDLMVRTLGRSGEVDRLIRQTQAGGRRLTVGDQVVVSAARAKGYPCALVESGEESIVAACQEAYSVLDALVAKDALTISYGHLDRQLKTVLHAVDDPVLILNERREVLQANPAASVFLGVNDREEQAALLGRLGENGRRAMFDLIPISSLGPITGKN